MKVPGPTSLSDAEIQLIDLVGHQLEYHRFPRPSGRLLGYAIVTGEPFTSVEVETALGMSAGGVSGALKPLTEMGLLRRVDVPGDRRHHYVHDSVALDRLLDAVATQMEWHRAQIAQRMRSVTRPGVAERVEQICRLSAVLGETMQQAAQRYRSEQDARG